MQSSFADLGLAPAVVAALAERGVTSPFPIQAATVPAALQGRDVSASAPTGSGKTLAFALPLLASLGRTQSRRPRALVLAPTRELAEQIGREMKPLAAVHGHRVVTVYGGTSISAQRRALERGVDVVVGCPGRLLDLIDRRMLDLAGVTFAVIDEADRMCDMGFLPVVRKLLDMTAASRQMLLFSATLDGDVGALVRNYQHDPLHVDVGHDDGRASQADHRFDRVERPERVGRLTELVRGAGPTIVFCRTRHGVDRLTKVLGRHGIGAVAIHGGHAQNRRDRALHDFTRGHARVLVATDVAARGIHVDGVEQVVHFDVAPDTKTYLHRSGRTARAGAAGRVVSFVGGEDVADVATLRRALGMEDHSRPATTGTRSRSRARSGAARRRRPATGAA
jgi:superfamily II DNA/RNA helicase